MSSPKLTMPLTLWKKMVKELKHRGYGERETGAFLLGDRENGNVTHFIPYDELDPHAFDSGIIIFHGDGYIPLWEFCTKHHLRVLADVHTHPGAWTGQSASDSKHPMIAQKGHIALIIPNYATRENQLLKGVGIHEFLGEKKWKVWTNEDGIFELIN